MATDLKLVPPPPEGFELDQTPAAPPAGFVLDAKAPPPPEGFVLDPLPSGSSLRLKKREPVDASTREEQVKQGTWDKLSPVDKLLSDVARGGRSALENVSTLLTGVGAITETMPVSSGPGAPQSPDIIQKNIERANRTKEQLAADIEKAQAPARAIKLYAEKTFPRVQPEAVKRPLGFVAEAVGQIAPSVATGPFAMFTGTITEFGDAFEREMERQKKEGESVDPEKALVKAGTYATATIPIELGLGVGRIVRKIKQYFGGETAEEYARKIAREGWQKATDFLKERAKDAGAGFAQEFSERITQDLIIEGEPDVAAAWQEGLAGATGQAVVGGAGQAAAAATKFVGRKSGSREQPKLEPRFQVGTDDLGRPIYAEPEKGKTDATQNVSVKEGVSSEPERTPAQRQAVEETGVGNRVPSPAGQPEQARPAERPVAAVEEKPVEPTPDSDSKRYAELVSVMKDPTADSKLKTDAWQELEAIKNRHGGKAPITPSASVAPSRTVESAQAGAATPTEVKPNVEGAVEQGASPVTKAGAVSSLPVPAEGAATLAAPATKPTGPSLRPKKAKGETKPAVPATQPAIPETKSPESETVKSGDWIEYTDSYGKTQQGRVSQIMKTGRIIPGAGVQPPKIEYMVEDAFGNAMVSPKEGTPVKKIAPFKVDLENTKPTAIQIARDRVLDKQSVQNALANSSEDAAKETIKSELQSVLGEMAAEMVNRPGLDGVGRTWAKSYDAAANPKDRESFARSIYSYGKRNAPTIKPAEAPTKASETPIKPLEKPPTEIKSPTSNLSASELSELEALEQELIKKLGGTYTGIDPEIAVIASKMANLYAKGGVRTFKQFATNVKERLPSIWERIKTYLRAAWNQIADMLNFAEVSRAEAESVFAELDKPAEKPTVEKETNERLLDQRSGRAESANAPAVGSESGTGGVPRGGRVGGEQPAPSESVGTGRESVDESAGGEQPSGGSPSESERGRGEQPGPARNLRPLRRAESDALAAKNYVITDADKLGQGSLKTKATDNLEAIRLVKQLESENRLPTQEEKAVLVRYVGWGGLKNVFNPDSKQFPKEYAELKKLLTDEEYDRAKASIQDAHYTSQTVIQRGIYGALKRLGFTGGKMVEGGVGLGHFIGLMPEDMRGSSYIGVERDPMTAKIAQYLYPEAKIYTQGFQEANLARNSFDASVGNPPFGDKAIYDKNFKASSKYSIHNYFIGKELELTRPGGIVAKVVSRYFLDNADPSAREHIATLGEFLGAIRLPNTAFKENANTEVVTDLVFFKRLPEGATSNTDWTKVVAYKDPESGLTWKVNKWIAEHPEMVLGKITKAEHGLYSENEMTVAPTANQDLGADLDKAVENLPANVYERNAPETEKRLTTSEPMPEGVKVNAFYTTKNGLFRRLPDVNGETQFVKVEMKEGTAERVKAMIPVRNALNALVRAELSKDTSEAQIAADRATLNRVYDVFVKKYGFLNSPTNRRAFYDDADATRVLGLERDYTSGISPATAKAKGVDAIAPSAKKADIFTKRVNVPYQEVTSVDTPKEALTVSLNQRGLVDLDYMAGLVNETPEKIVKDLEGLIFKTSLGGYESKEQYLSGNVREKLLAAEAAGPDFAKNVEALKAVVPKDIDPTDIIAPIGAPWISAKDVSKFAEELTGSAPSVAIYLKANAGWGFEHKDRSTASVQKWGTPRMPFGDMMKLLLNGKPVVVYDFIDAGDGKEQRVVNQQETELANAKASELKDKWQEWVWSDKERRDRLHRLYNDTYNNYVDFKADGSHLTLPGASPVITLNTHQKNVVWRTITAGGNGSLYDHVVGAGKTFAAIGSMMELRRLGRVHKWLVAVPNHLTGQWADAFNVLYPNANILAAKPSDFGKENRQKLFSKILTGDYDAVILGHSNLKKIGTSPEVEKSILEEMMKEIVETIEAMKKAEGSAGRKRGSRQVAQMEKTKDNIQAKLDRLSDIGGRDTVAMFEELGFDGLLVDEAHEFKNLYYTTQLQNVAGLGTPAGSQKAFDLYLKTRYLRNQFGGKAPIVFLTGTPISNSLVEMFTMQRYLQPDVLEGMGLKTLDAWAKVFADIRAVYEVDPTGTGYRMATRLANFQNVGELTAIYRNMADVITMDDLQAQAEAAGKRFPVPKVKGGKPANIVAERTPEQANYFGIEEQLLDSEGKPQFDTEGNPITAYPKGTILWRVDNMPDDPSEDNMLKLTNDARKAGLDMRLINPAMPDRPQSKVNLAVKEIERIYKQWTPQKGTQLVFCDLSVPASARGRATSKAKTGGVGYYIKFGKSGELKAVDGDPVKFASKPDYEFFIRKSENGSWVISERTSGLSIGAYGKTRALAMAEGERILGNVAPDVFAQKVAESQPSPEALADLAESQKEVAKVEAESEAADESSEQGVSADEILADQSSFSVYDDMKAKLIKAGIPAQEIAFIHDYDTPEKKQKLFKQVNDGTVRVLFGSTAKMGAGMNVQRRLVGLHHMDAPWRPSDLEQREGRAIRQGNLFYEEAIKNYANPQDYDKDPKAFAVEINRYATGLSYDTRMWQLIEHKAAGIEGFRKADRSTRRIEDIGGEAANASDMKAAASGDPMIQQELQLRNDLNKLQLLKKAWDRNRIELQNREAYLTDYQKRYQSRVDELNARKAMLEKNTPVDDKGKPKFEFTLPDGKKTEDKGTALDRVVAMLKDGKRGYMGKYRGQPFSFEPWQRGDNKGVTFYAGENEYLNGKTVTTFFGEERLTGVGLFQRFDNYLEVADTDYKAAEDKRDREKETLAEVHKESAKVFPKESELAKTRAEHESVRTQLMNKKKKKVAPQEPSKPLPLEGWDVVEGTDSKRDSTHDALLNGNPNVEAVLGALESKVSNSFEYAIIQKLRSLGLKTTFRLAPQSEAATLTENRSPAAGGLYLPDSDEVVIFESAVNQGKTLLHELIHAATVQSIEQKPEYRLELERMLSEARNALGDMDYGTKNVYEFLAEAYSNRLFQDRLNTVFPKSGKQSLWQRFLAWLRRIFGVSEKDASLFERVIKASAKEIRAPSKEAPRIQLPEERPDLLSEAENLGDETVQIAGIQYNILGKDKLTAEQKAAADERARDYLGKELKLPGVPDRSYAKQTGSTDLNMVFTVKPDGQKHDASGEALREHLIQQIKQQSMPGGDPAYVSSLVNAINKNFNVGNLHDVFSQEVVRSLMEVSAGESSRRGQMLRAITGITEDMRAVGMNADYFLRFVYNDAFGGELVRKVMDKIASNFAEPFTGEEIERIYNENPKFRELFDSSVARLKVKPSIRQVMAEILSTPINRQDDLEKRFVRLLVEKFKASPDEAERLGREFTVAFAKSFEVARKRAQEKALAALTPAEKKLIAPDTSLGSKLVRLVNSGWFDSGEVVKDEARSRRWKVPTDAEIEQMRQWAIREQELSEPTPEDVEQAGGDEERARETVRGATLEARQELLRKMNTTWSQWTHPITAPWRKDFYTDPIKRFNTANAVNEWMAANLLLKVGFGTRQMFDVLSQMVLHTPTRAAQYAFEQWSNDKSAGRDANLMENLSTALTDAYKARSKVLKDTLNSFARTIKGRGEQKNVEQLLSAISVFDRMLLNAEKMKAEGRGGAARLLTLTALTLRFGRQFAAAADILQGMPAEIQEIAGQIRTGLKEQGKTGAELELEYDNIMGLLTTARAEAISEATQLLEARGLETSRSSVQRAAWHILRQKIYFMAKNAGLPADEWKAQNAYYRNVIGWNEPETQGLGKGKIGGPGGLVALGMKAGRDWLAGVGIPGFPFVFGNAMGISMNRKLAWTPLGFFPGFFKGSPWFEGERNQRQRKIEAAIGTGLGSIFFALAALGVWTVLQGTYPTDDKEREKWISKGYQPGMVIVPMGDGQEMKISTRVGPLAFFGPALAAGGALRRGVEEQAKKQARLNEEAAKLGKEPVKLEGLDATQLLAMLGQAGWSAVAGGRTASGLIGSYSDFGRWNPKKSTASAVSSVTPGLPGFQELSRMAGSNIDPKLASFWDLLVPLPTSGANRVNVLGDPLRNQSDVERVVGIMSGGTYPLPTSSEMGENVAYANLYGSDFRPPSVNPGRGYAFGNEYRPMNEAELEQYTKLRGQYFKENLTNLGQTTDKKAVQEAFKQANARALGEIGASQPASKVQSPAVASAARTVGGYSARPRSRSLGSLRLRSGRRRSIRGGSLRLRGPSLRLGRRGLKLPKAKGASLRFRRRRLGSLRLR